MRALWGANKSRASTVTANRFIPSHTNCISFVVSEHCRTPGSCSKTNLRKACCYKCSVKGRKRRGMCICVHCSGLEVSLTAGLAGCLQDMGTNGTFPSRLLEALTIFRQILVHGEPLLHSLYLYWTTTRKGPPEPCRPSAATSRRPCPCCLPVLCQWALQGPVRERTTRSTASAARLVLVRPRVWAPTLRCYCTHKLDCNCAGVCCTALPWPASQALIQGDLSTLPSSEHESSLL